MVESPGLVIDDEYPLSPLQQGMLFHSLDRSDAGVDLEQVLCTLTEPLDVSQLLAAWATVVARYDILRTSFEWEGRPEPVQNVHRFVTVPARVLDWCHFTADERRERLASLMADDRATRFTLDRAPLMRLTIATCGPLHHEVLWTFHHAILDGRSFPILLREVFGIYDAARTGAECNLPKPRQYRAYIDWLAARNPEASKAFWRRRLAGAVNADAAARLCAFRPSGRGRQRRAQADARRNTAPPRLCARRPLHRRHARLRCLGPAPQPVHRGRRCPVRRDARLPAVNDRRRRRHGRSLRQYAAVSHQRGAGCDGVQLAGALRGEQIAFREHEHTPLCADPVVERRAPRHAAVRNARRVREPSARLAAAPPTAGPGSPAALRIKARRIIR